MHTEGQQVSKVEKVETKVQIEYATFTNNQTGAEYRVYENGTITDSTGNYLADGGMKTLMSFMIEGVDKFGMIF